MTAEDRKKFANELIEADMHQDHLEEYLQSDMSKSPKEFLEIKEGEIGENELKEYMDEKFPETKGGKS